MHRFPMAGLLAAASLSVLSPSVAPLRAQNVGAARQGRGARAPRGWRGAMDSTRARALYVSDDFKDLAGCGPNDCEAQTKARLRDDSIFAARSRGVLSFEKVHYKSRADGLDIPAELFGPLDTGNRPHAALVWVHDGIHGHLRPQLYWPFIREAVERGYVVIAPEYRGSTGYGDAFYRKIDYGGWEVDDALSAVDYLRTLPYVDMNRLGVIGWSHGGFITAHLLFRGETPFKAGAAIVPVTNLIFRLSDHGPAYTREYAAEERIHGMPFERTCGETHDQPCIDEYMARSPVFQVPNLKVPILVHVATNDCDVFFREDQQMIYSLQALKPDLAETKIYTDPPPGPEGCGHTFSRRVDPQTLERQDTPAQVDSWNRTWAFFDKHLRG